MYVIATRIGKIQLAPYYSFVNKNEKEYTIINYKGEKIALPNISEEK